MYAENEALRWMADSPVSRRGRRCVRTGGTAGNLSALIGRPLDAAADAGACGPDAGETVIGRGPLVGGVGGAGDGCGRRRRAGRWAPTAPINRRIGDARSARGRRRGSRLFAVVASAGATNVGVVDDLPPPAAVCAGTWLHVDGAYGWRRLLPPRRAAVRRSRARRQLHRRSAQVAVRAVRLLRPALPRPGDRTSGAHPACRVPRRPPRPRRPSGTRPTTRSTSRAAPADFRSGSPSRPTAPTPTPRRSRRRWRWPSVAAEIEAAPFRTSSSSSSPSCRSWCSAVRGGTQKPTRRGATNSWPTEQSFVTPTAWNGKTVLRWCIVNPLTTVDDLAAIVDSLGMFDGEPVADLAIVNARSVATMDGARRELAGGWVAVPAGRHGRGRRHPVRRRRRRPPSTPPTAWSRRA